MIAIDSQRCFTTLATTLSAHDWVGTMPQMPKRKMTGQATSDSKSDKIRELLKAGQKPSTIAKQVGCTPALVYNVRARAAGGTKKRAKAGRSAASRNASHDDGMTAILNAVKTADQDRAKMREALERIQAILADALP